MFGLVRLCLEAALVCTSLSFASLYLGDLMVSGWLEDCKENAKYKMSMNTANSMASCTGTLKLQSFIIAGVNEEEFLRIAEKSAADRMSVYTGYFTTESISMSCAGIA